jgi:hypothetical protein
MKYDCIQISRLVRIRHRHPKVAGWLEFRLPCESAP